MAGEAVAPGYISQHQSTRGNVENQSSRGLRVFGTTLALKVAVDETKELTRKGNKMKINTVILALIIMAQGTTIFANSGALVNNAATSALAGFDNANAPQAIRQSTSIRLRLNQLLNEKDIVSVAQYFEQYGLESREGKLWNSFRRYRTELYSRITGVIQKVEQDMREKPKGTWDLVDALYQGRDCFWKFFRQVRLPWDEVALAKAIVSCESLYDADYGTDYKKGAANNRALLTSLATLSNCLLAEVKQYRAWAVDARSKEMGKLHLKMAIKGNLPIYMALKKNVLKIVRKYRSERNKGQRRQYAKQIKPFIAMAKKFSALWKASQSGSIEITKAHSLVEDAMKEMQKYVAAAPTSTTQSPNQSSNPFNF